MEKSFEVMVSAKELITMGFKPYQAKQMIRKCKDYLVTSEGIEFYRNRQVRIVPARIIEKLFNIQIT